MQVNCFSEIYGQYVCECGACLSERVVDFDNDLVTYTSTITTFGVSSRARVSQIAPSKGDTTKIKFSSNTQQETFATLQTNQPTYKERVLQKGEKNIQRLCSTLNLQDQVVQTALKLWKSYNSQGIRSNKSVFGLAIIHEACSICSCGLTFKELIKAFPDFSLKELRRAYLKIQKLKKSPNRPSAISVAPQKSERSSLQNLECLLARVLEELNLLQEKKGVSKVLHCIAPLLEGKKPNTVVGCAILHYIIQNNKDVSQQNLAKEATVSVQTLRKTLSSVSDELYRAEVMMLL